jgi:hypothetical protein
LLPAVTLSTCDAEKSSATLNRYRIATSSLRILYVKVRSSTCVTGGSRPGQARTPGSVGHLVRVSPNWYCASCASFRYAGDPGVIQRRVQPQLVLRIVCLLGRCGRVCSGGEVSPSSCCAWCASFEVWAVVRVSRQGFSPSWCCASFASLGVRACWGGGFSPSSCCASFASFGARAGVWIVGRGGQPQLVLRIVCLLRGAGGRVDRRARGSAPARAAHGVPPSGRGRACGSSGAGVSPSSCCASQASSRVQVFGGGQPPGCSIRDESDMTSKSLMSEISNTG